MMRVGRHRKLPFAILTLNCFSSKSCKKNNKRCASESVSNGGPRGTWARGIEEIKEDTAIGAMGSQHRTHRMHHEHHSELPHLQCMTGEQQYTPHLRVL